MTIEIPKVRKPLDLGGYSPELKGHFLYIWVNPPRGLKNEYFSSTYSLGIGLQAAEKPEDFNFIQRIAKGRKRQKSARKIVRWYAQLWSETDEGDSFGGAEIEAFAEELVDKDPAMWSFLCNATWVMINEWVETSKKALPVLSSKQLKQVEQRTPS